jgi:putative tricarboxylic transport membrane protein
MWLQEKSISVFFLAISVFVIHGSLKLGLGNPAAPGPGFAPFLGSLLLFMLVAFDLLGRKRKPKEEQGTVNQVGRYRGVGLVSALCIYVFTLEFLGYLLSAFILVFASLLLFDRKKWHFPLFFTIVVVNLTFFLFCKLLQVQLPAGRLGITW